MLIILKEMFETSSSKYFIAASGPNVNSTLINRLQKEDVKVFWSTEKITSNSKTYNPGSVIISNDNKSQKLLADLANELHLQVDALNDVDETKIKELKKVKVGLYQPFTANMDEGWTRLLLENYNFDFTVLHNKDFKDKKLKEKFDVIIIPEMSGDLIKTGYYSGEYARYNRPKPPEYDSGLGRIGVENLKAFVEKDGGYLITLGEACNFAIEDLGLRVTNVLKNVKNEEFFCPGSLLKLNVDNTNPIGYGMEEEIIGYQNNNIAFSTSIPFGQFDRSVVARYPTKDLLKSGFLLGEDYLYKRAAIVDVKQKKGHVILLDLRFRIVIKHLEHLSCCSMPFTQRE